MKNRHPLIVLLAAAYLFLTISPMTCGLDHADGHHNGHHHNSVSHSSFCAWACQANPATGMVTPEWSFVPVGAVPLLFQIPASVCPIHLSCISVPRGPPPPTARL